MFGRYCILQIGICRVVQNRIYTPYLTVCMVISLPKYRIYNVYTYKCMVLANPRYMLIVHGTVHGVFKRNLPAAGRTL